MSTKASKSRFRLSTKLKRTTSIISRDDDTIHLEFDNKFVQPKSGNEKKAKTLMKMLGPDLNFSLLEALCESTDPMRYGEIANCILRLPNDTLIESLSFLIDHQIKASQSETLLFRNDSLSVSVLNIYFKRSGRDFLYKVLRPVLKKIIKQNSPCEIDPQRLSKQINLERNIENLKECCEKFLDNLIKEVQYLPTGMRLLFQVASEATEKRFEGMGQRSISALLFLRFVCPAIVTPELFEFVTPKVPISPKQRRSLILVSKVIQALSNDILFGTKELYMTVMNPFIEKNRSSCNALLHSLAVFDEDITDIPSQFFELTDEEQKKATDYIVKICFSLQDSICAFYASENNMNDLHRFKTVMMASPSFGLRAVHQEIKLRNKGEETQQALRKTKEAMESIKKSSEEILVRKRPTKNLEKEYDNDDNDDDDDDDDSKKQKKEHRNIPSRPAPFPPLTKLKHTTSAPKLIQKKKKDGKLHIRFSSPKKETSISTPTPEEEIIYELLSEASPSEKIECAVAMIKTLLESERQKREALKTENEILKLKISTITSLNEIKGQKLLRLEDDMQYFINVRAQELLEEGQVNNSLSRKAFTSAHTANRTRRNSNHSSDSHTPDCEINKMKHLSSSSDSSSESGHSSSLKPKKLSQRKRSKSTGTACNSSSTPVISKGSRASKGSHKSPIVKSSSSKQPHTLDISDLIAKARSSGLKSPKRRSPLSTHEKQRQSARKGTSKEKNKNTHSKKKGQRRKMKSSSLTKSDVI